MHTRHSKNSRHPRVMLIFSMAVFGTLGVFTRNIQVSSGELALYRAILAAGLILVYLLVTRQPVPFSSIQKQMPLLLASLWVRPSSSLASGPSLKACLSWPAPPMRSPPG